MVLLRKSWMVWIAALGGTVLWFALLAGRPLYDPDEGRYAEIPREMLSGGDWVIPHLNALVYLEKPPLQYWLTALTFRDLGQSEFTARLCTGVAGFLSLITVFLLGRALWGLDAGIRALSYTGASTLFVLLGHQLTLDMLLSFFLTAALGCFLMAQAGREDAARRRSWMLGCWAAMALAVLTKGLIGVLIPAATAGLYLVWQRDWRLLRNLNLRCGLPLFAAIAAPWFVLAARANGQFLRFFFIREHFQRFLTPIEHRSQPWWFFVPVLIVGVLPWLPQAARALISSREQRLARDRFDASRLLWIWCVFVFIFFSLSDSKLIPYILPAVPALALLCAGNEDADSRRSLTAGALLTLLFSAGIAAYAGGWWSSASGRPLMLLIRPTLAATIALLAIGAIVAMVCARRDRPRMALTILSAAWFLASGSILVAADVAQSLFSAKDVALALRRQAVPDGLGDGPAGGVADGSAGGLGDVPADVPIFAVQSYEQSLPFYLKRPVVLVDYRDEFDLGLREEPQRGIATLRQFAELWLALRGGFAVMPPETRDKLSALGLPMREIARFPDRVMVSRR
jgi:4-amino-4-deoxy-L-arabinose transferase-like glycosyltransferase